MSSADGRVQHASSFASQRAKAAATAAITIPIEPAIWFALPVKGAGGAPVAEGPLELPCKLLTIKDGQGVPSGVVGFDLVTVTSGAGPEGQAVPQGARIVDVLCAWAPAIAASERAIMENCIVISCRCKKN